MINIEDYIKYENGTVPLVFSVSHGGLLECDSIPKRSSGIRGVDRNTIGLTNRLITCIETIAVNKDYTDIKPSYIISYLRRSKIDLNRPKTEAYENNSAIAGEIYDYYHEKLEEIIFNNISRFHHSLLIDIHGFESNKRPQGYRDVDIILGTNNLQSLFSTPIPKRDWNKNIRGRIIEKCLEMDISVAPGHQRRDEYVLKGGFTTLTYGASKIQHSQAIQIEFSDKIRYQDKNLKKKIISLLAEVLFNEILEY
ncbi:MAG: N-formylglutamate amidohydrolase [archaeon]|nr:N-formylglutamate amidohydrolase [archaeon]